MEVEFAFLADAAQAINNKLYVLGGGFDRIFAERFPAIHPNIAFVLKLKLHSTEAERQHSLEIELWNPDGQRIGGSLSAVFTAQRHQEDPAQPIFVQLVLNIANLALPAPGDYDFHVIINREHRKAVPLSVRQVPGAAPPQVGEGTGE